MHSVNQTGEMYVRGCVGKIRKKNKQLRGNLQKCKSRGKEYVIVSCSLSVCGVSIIEYCGVIHYTLCELGEVEY